jgi:hypothetical protein
MATFDLGVSGEVEMRAQLLLQVGVAASATKEPTQPPQQFHERPHPRHS